MRSDQAPEPRKTIEESDIASADRVKHASDPALPPFSAKWATGGRLATIAVVLVIVAAGLTARTFRQPPSVLSSAPLVSVRTGPTERREIRIGDNAVAMLESNSRIRYLVTRTRTDVTLTGIARFKVAHSMIRVFDVRARNAHIVDLGTDFIVRASDADTVVTVEVAAGRVALNDLRSEARPERRRGTSVEVSAGQSAILLPDGRTLVNR